MNTKNPPVNRDTRTARIHKLVGVAMLTALVIIVQLIAGYIPRIGGANLSFVLVPIVVGAALYGTYAGLWLGFAFGCVVLFGTDVAFFANISLPGTVLTVLAKGILCGLGAGLVYHLLAKRNQYLGVVAAAVVCPVINTGIFWLGCRLFYWDAIGQIASSEGAASTAAYFIVAYIGINFLVELAINIILAPAILRLIQVGKKKI